MQPSQALPITQPAQQTVEQFTYARLLLDQADSILDRGGPVASSMACLSMQDAVEMALRAVAREVRSDNFPKDPLKVTFFDLLTNAERCAGGVSVLRASMSDLNQLRVNFKHGGIRAHEETVNRLKYESRAFVDHLCRVFLDRSLDSMSLVFVIRSVRCRLRLEQARHALESSQWDAALRCCALAFNTFLSYCAARPAWDESGYRGPRPFANSLTGFATRSGDGSLSGLARGVDDLSEWVGKRLLDLEWLVEIDAAGVSIQQWRRFERIAPVVIEDGAGSFTTHHRVFGPSASEDAARFCFEFVTQALIRLQSSPFADPTYLDVRPLAQMNVIRDCELTDIPTSDDAVVVRIAKAGETLRQVQAHSRGTEKLRVWDGADLLWVEQRNVEAAAAE